MLLNIAIKKQIFQHSSFQLNFGFKIVCCGLIAKSFYEQRFPMITNWFDSLLLANTSFENQYSGILLELPPRMCSLCS